MMQENEEAEPLCNSVTDLQRVRVQAVWLMILCVVTV